MGFAPVYVEYEIHGEIVGGSPGSYNEPPDPGELEITEVRFIDPVSGEDSLLPENHWPFDDAETRGIFDRLGDVAVCDDYYDYDYYDYYG